MKLQLPFLRRYLMRSEICGTLLQFWCLSIPAVMGVDLVSPRILSDVKIYWKAK